MGNLELTSLRDALIDELRAIASDAAGRRLYKTIGGNVEASVATRALTRVVAKWARFHGATHVRYEVALPGVRRFTERGYPLQGYVDMIAYWKERSIAFELDRGNKKWSLDKLDAAAAQGHEAVWIRWSGGNVRVTPPTVSVIHLGVPEQVAGR